MHFQFIKLGEFVEGNPRELAANYLKVLSGVMTLTVSEEDESLPDVGVSCKILRTADRIFTSEQAPTESKP
jgi:hypothetical protein